jgi:ubiquinone/menaquinone biosynthesis C-methylase UbiE
LGKNSPGGFELIAYAVRKAGLKEDSRILDIGCGEGETMEMLKERFNIRCSGIDKSAELVNRGKTRYPDMDIREGEADFLEFPIRSFDGVLLECVLSVADMQTEVIHESYCVLKDGGKLIISDLFVKGVRPRRREGQDDGACGSLCDAEVRGAIDPEKLVRVCEEIGFREMLWEDRSNDLNAFVAETIMQYGSMEEYFSSVVPEGMPAETFCGASETDKKIGYFLLIMEKPKKSVQC